MHTTEPRIAPGGTVLVAPRTWLQTQAVLAGVARGLSTPWLAHGPLVLQQSWPHRLALIGPLRQGPPTPVPVRARTEATLTPDHHIDGLTLLMLAPTNVPFPVAWETWLHTHGPDFRLACEHPAPAVAVLWLRSDGVACAALRERGRWQPCDTLRIAGARWAQVPLPWTVHPVVSTPAMGQARTHAAERHEAVDGQRRDSRLVAALGPPVLSRLQNSRVTLVGVGRIGSRLAHGLVRLGVRHVLMIDPDTVELHNLDGDIPPLLEGRSKVEAVMRFVRPLLRPGATVDARHLPIASPVAGGLLAETDVVIVCVDNDAARLWANAWALAHHINLIAITTGQHTDPATGQRLAAAELRLLPAGTGCLACLGGWAQADTLAAQLQSPLPPPTPADVRQQRPGSLRSWAGIAADMGLRMLEQLAAGDVDHALFRRLQETPNGGLEVHDSTLPPQALPHGCGLCAALRGAGLAAVTAQGLQTLAQEMPNRAAQR